MNDYRHLARHARGTRRHAAVAGVPRAAGGDRLASTGARVTPRRGALIDPIGRRAPLGLPCQVHEEDLWFADEPGQLERAKELCTSCPVLRGCLAGAVQREEHAGVWGGQIFDRGRIVTHKRPRGRPRKNSTAPQRRPASSAIPALTTGEPVRERHREGAPSSRARSSPEQTRLSQGGYK